MIISQELEGTEVLFGDVSDPRNLADVAFSGEPVDVVVSCLASRTGGKVHSQTHTCYLHKLAAMRLPGRQRQGYNQAAADATRGRTSATPGWQCCCGHCDGGGQSIKCAPWWLQLQQQCCGSQPASCHSNQKHHSCDWGIGAALQIHLIDETLCRSA